MTCVAYPLGLRGVIVGDGETFEEALDNVKHVIAFHIETFGADFLGEPCAAEDIFLAEAEVAVNVQVPSRRSQGEGTGYPGTLRMKV